MQRNFYRKTLVKLGMHFEDSELERDYQENRINRLRSLVNAFINLVLCLCFIFAITMRDEVSYIFCVIFTAFYFIQLRLPKAKEFFFPFLTLMGGMALT